MLTMIDMGIGNLQSVRTAFERIGASVRTTTDPTALEEARVVVLPGVGAFGDGMAALEKHGLVEPLRQHAQLRRRPLIGICLGMQLLADESEEHGRHVGLGLVPGRVVRLSPGESERVPNMGWCDLTVRRRAVLCERIPDGEPFYFAHSYHLVCAEPADCVATISYGGQPVTAAVERENVMGLQCHPEKSQHAGLELLAAFCRKVGVLS